MIRVGYEIQFVVQWTPWPMLILSQHWSQLVQMGETVPLAGYLQFFLETTVVGEVPEHNKGTAYTEGSRWSVIHTRKWNQRTWLILGVGSLTFIYMGLLVGSLALHSRMLQVRERACRRCSCVAVWNRCRRRTFIQWTGVLSSWLGRCWCWWWWCG